MTVVVPVIAPVTAPVPRPVTVVAAIPPVTVAIAVMALACSFPDSAQEVVVANDPPGRVNMLDLLDGLNLPYRLVPLDAAVTGWRRFTSLQPGEVRRWALDIYVGTDLESSAERFLDQFNAQSVSDV